VSLLCSLAAVSGFLVASAVLGDELRETQMWSLWKRISGTFFWNRSKTLWITGLSVGGP
jgi:hypothetical protein